MITLKFSHKYSKLEHISNGDVVRCIAASVMKMKDIPLWFLLRDIAPNLQVVTDLSHFSDTQLINVRIDINDFFRSFGYKNFGDNTEMGIYWFIGDDIFHTIRKPDAYLIGDIVKVEMK